MSSLYILISFLLSINNQKSTLQTNRALPSDSIWRKRTQLIASHQTVTMSGPSKAVLLAWIPRVAMFLALGGALVSTWLLVFDINLWLAMFCTIFILRYTRFLGHLIGYWIYRPSPIQPEPSFTRHDVTVLIPTIDPTGPAFTECVRTILANGPARIILVTVGAQMKAECRQVLFALAPAAGDTHLSVTAISEPSKRKQVSYCMDFVRTPLTVMADDHVFWSERFLASVLAPFADEKVGAVATKKRVRRTTPGEWSFMSILNFIACNYLERHNWELRANNAIDGGVFVVSGRTAIYRTEFLLDKTLLDNFCNEKFFFGLFGGVSGLGPDDDNTLSRNLMQQGWLIRFQDTGDATIETTLGEWPKFTGQISRWARTTFRSNPVMLRSPKFLFRYTWSAFMVYWAGMVNFALLWDVALLASLIHALSALEASTAWVMLLVIWIITTKAVKILPHLIRHPSDIVLFPFQIAFAYVHSLFKFWALLTFWDCGWSGRNLDDVNVDKNDAEVRAFEVIC